MRVQGAYGMLAEVESHPFDVNSMLFMDWRDDHATGQLKEDNLCGPHSSSFRLRCSC